MKTIALALVVIICAQIFCMPVQQTLAFPRRGAALAEISNPRSQTSDLRSQISDLRSQISNPRSQISDLRSQISNLRSQIIGDISDSDTFLQAATRQPKPARDNSRRVADLLARMTLRKKSAR
jgi:predicted  nucleic acid-binding Zn-ribbon protein